MAWIRPEDSGYDEARRLFNAWIDKRPAVIAQCATPAEVAEALAYGRREGLPIAVRAGGHSVAGYSTNDGGLVIDVRPMKSAEVDPEARTVRAGAGLTWHEYDTATQAHGLASTGGRASTTGIAGFTLGGGSGWLERTCGLACDSLVSVDLVTADGEYVTASADENPELFWALHGGGGNFGVATSLTYQLQPLGPEVAAGLLVWPGDRTREILGAYRDLAHAADRRLGSVLVLFTAPAGDDSIPESLWGRPAVLVGFVFNGPGEEGLEAIHPFRDLDPAADFSGLTPYVDFQCSIDDPADHFNYWSADYHDELSDAALDVFAASCQELPSPESQQLIVPWDGAVAEGPASGSPLAHRKSAWVSHPFGIAADLAGGERARDWTRRFRSDIAPYTNGGVYLNFIGDEGQGRVRAAFGDENYARLAQVKKEFDPGNVFRGNQNIRPGE
ncbi:FAD-binding oxidoreductase [Sinomonas mesophila]|uniref:FAD-binding oxidoreductase n=1 Tax=Sinomonas mesophila TaxID=1531955 RepID=UPI0009879D44|nr:FAD-binding oxidoreductase [Sinomonas mesophila]